MKKSALLAMPKLTATPEMKQAAIADEPKQHENPYGYRYLCLSVEKRPLLNDTTAQMRRTSDGWTLTAHGLIRYEDGTIEWNYSTGGRWSESK
ncbi:hypothetical protein KFE16_09550 [Clostridiaceae bacterium Marseille-Q4149]|nr:hypothetical protein KFE16_09550 [Clostridiaceae bacterium Marseille-Q4149]